MSRLNDESTSTEIDVNFVHGGILLLNSLDRNWFRVQGPRIVLFATQHLTRFNHGSTSTEMDVSSLLGGVFFVGKVA